MFPALLAMTPLSTYRGEVDGAVPRPTWLSLVTLGFFFQISKRDFCYNLDLTSLKTHVRVSSLYISTSLNKDVKLKLKL